MNNIYFPGLGLKFTISKIAFSIFGIDIYWYSICIVLGILVALFLCKFSKNNYEIKFEDVIDVTIFALFFGIIGARLYYILFNINYYFKDPIKIFYIRDGGLAIYGGLILGGIVAYFRSKKLKLKVLNLLDYIVPFVAIAQSIGRWGNFFNIEAYGVECKNFLRMRISEYVEVHPTFLYESIATFVIFCILRILQKNRKFPGEIFLLYLILYSGIRFFIEGIRADSLMFFGFRVSKILSLVIFLFSLCMFLLLKKKANKTKIIQNKC